MLFERRFALIRKLLCHRVNMKILVISLYIVQCTITLTFCYDKKNYREKVVIQFVKMDFL